MKFYSYHDSRGYEILVSREILLHQPLRRFRSFPLSWVRLSKTSGIINWYQGSSINFLYLLKRLVNANGSLQLQTFPERSNSQEYTSSLSASGSSYGMGSAAMPFEETYKMPPRFTGLFSFKSGLARCAYHVAK
ncbi:hypothetical protein VNO77_34353 [Canavalia gladiata]|uniref:Uncharacterized protein n=1 Tax=Canavalia gladiata TaxID=3824 RepID=A0AAN9KEX1_CANGL